MLLTCAEPDLYIFSISRFPVLAHILTVPHIFARSFGKRGYLPSAALPDAEGRGLLFVAGLEPGDRVLAKADPRGAVEVVKVRPHAAGSSAIEAWVA